MRIQPSSTEPDQPDAARRLTRTAMAVSLGAGFLMLGLKLTAYAFTGSAAILSDAAESVVHVLAVSFAAYSLWLSTKPADSGHLYGHDRVTFFSAGVEGAAIVVAAVYIVYEAVREWVHGLRVENLGGGALLVLAATVVNGILGRYLVHQGRKHHSMILLANGKHVLTDCWTSGGVVIGLVLTHVTGWLSFDPLVAILVAVNILFSGVELVRRSIGGLMDETDPEVQSSIVRIIWETTGKRGIRFHDVRYRNAGNKLHVEFHLLFPDHTPISEAHECATRVEAAIQAAFDETVQVTSHLEPLEAHDASHDASGG